MSHNPFDKGYYETSELGSFGFGAVGDKVRISKNCTIIGLGNIYLGSDIRIDDNVVISAYDGGLHVGNHVHIASGCYLGCAGGVTLSDFSGLSQAVRIHSGSDDYSGAFLTNPTIPSQYLNVDVRPVCLSRHVIVGSGSIILPGVTIGEGTAIGALTVIAKSTQEWSIYSGHPARRLKERQRGLLALEKQLLSEI